MKFPYNPILCIQQDYRDGRLTREEAKEKLAFLLDLDGKTDYCPEALPDHGATFRDQFASYGPILRLSDVCNVLSLWAQLYCQELPHDDPWKKEEQAEFRKRWERIYLAITKSNFLARLFFTDEGVRQTPCPMHHGHWSGCFSEHHDGKFKHTGDGNESGPCLCQAGGNITGWLAEDPQHCDRTYWDAEKKEYRMRSESDPGSPRIG